MSQHNFYLKQNEQVIHVFMGWDRPLKQDNMGNKVVVHSVKQKQYNRTYFADEQFNYFGLY